MINQQQNDPAANDRHKRIYSRKELEDLEAFAKYKEAFDTFDWNKTSNIATHVSKHFKEGRTTKVGNSLDTRCFPSLASAAVVPPLSPPVVASLPLSAGT